MAVAVVEIVGVGHVDLGAQQVAAARRRDPVALARDLQVLLACLELAPASSSSRCCFSASK